MAYSRLDFTKNWKNEADFPTYEESETKVRADMQELHDQTRRFINGTLIPELEAEVFGGKTYLNKSVAPADWAADDTISLFPYKADIACTGVLTYDVPLVTFAQSDADSGILCPIAETGTNIVRIFANEIPKAAVRILSIFCVKGGSE